VRIGVYVDAENLNRCGGFRMQYSVLREFACRNGGEAVRLNVYLAYDFERARQDEEYRSRTNAFHTALRDQGFKVCAKEIRWHTDKNGVRYPKANADLDLAVDALNQSANLDRVLLATGDGDFVCVIQNLQSRGCRVEVVGLGNVSAELRQEADLFLSGYLIPGLIPFDGPGKRDPAWGEEGSRVRGWCAAHNTSFGFFNFLEQIEDLYQVNPRHPNSPYASVFFHDSQLPAGVQVQDLPSRVMIFEFSLFRTEQGLTARNITLC
jgi:uncharacterized LabA/DUF88 family protein